MDEKPKPRSAAQQAQKGPATAEEHQQRVLVMTAAAGFIDAEIAGLLLWPRNPNRRKYAEQLLARLTAAKLLFRRQVGPRRGAYVLTKKGAAGVGARPGMGWGKTKRDDNGVSWSPPKTYIHDRRAARFAAYGAQTGKLHPVFERESRTGLEDETVADCLLVDPEAKEAIWIEVENSKKKASQRAAQIEAAIRRREMAKTTDTPWGVVRIAETGWVLAPLGWKDSRGYAIDHEPLLRREWAAAVQERISFIEDKAEFQRISQEDAESQIKKLRELLTARVWRETAEGFVALPKLAG